MPPETPAPCSVKLAPSAAVIDRVSPGFTLYSSSPKRSPISLTIAASAFSASSPSVSMRTRLPLPAASIITPMMLFAFTRRPLRDSHTSAAKAPATSVSLAAARACRPSLLTISASVCAIADIGGEMDDAFLSAAHRLFDDRGERLVTVGQRPDQHREARAREAFHPAGLQQPGGDVRGRRAEHVGQHQYSFSGVELAKQLPRAGQDRVGVVAQPHAHMSHLLGTLAEDVTRAVDERLAEGAVRDDEDSDHGLHAASSASRNIPATLKPVCCVISWKQVGLVTLISVR